MSRLITDAKLQRFDAFLRPIQVVETGITETPATCIQVQDEWVPVIIGALEPLRWRDKWSGTPEQIAFCTGQIELLIALLAADNSCEDTDVATRFRQNSIDPCVLEVSYDGGVTWGTMFDYSLCFANLPGTQVTNYNTYQQYQTDYNTLINQYDGTPGSIAPDLVHQEDGKNAQRDAVLCYALENWLKLVVGTLKELKKQQSAPGDELKWFAAAAGIIVGIAPFVFGLAVPLWVAGIALAGSGAALGDLIWGAISEAGIEVFNDQAAIDAVQCCMYSALKGQTVTEVLFRGSLDNCGFAGGNSNAETLRDLVQVVLQEDVGVYVTFMNLMQQLYDAVEAGADMPGCKCEAPWEEVFYAERLESVWDIVKGARVGDTIRQDTIEGQTYFVVIEFLVSRSVRIIYAEMEFVSSQKSASADFDLNISTPFKVLLNVDDQAVGAHVAAWEGSAIITTKIQLVADSANPGVGFKRLTLRGTGYNPWANL